MATATRYKPYPKMKPSGVDWIGKIPDEWNIEYMKNLGRFESSGIDKKIVEGEPLIQMVNYTDIYGNESRMIDSKRELMTVSCPAWKIPEANLIKGDLVFTPSSETTEDIGLSALISENLKNTVFSYHVIRFRFSKELDNDFKKYLCNNTFVWQQFSRLAKGTTRQILDRNDFKNIFVVIPSLEDQKSIADFLDRETAKIDGVVAKKQKLIELLREKRQALITQAVTKGLNPKAKMKPSGIDWLGEIPEGWEVKRLRFVMQLNPSKSELAEPSETLVTFLPMEAVSESGEINTEQEKRISEVIEGYTYFRDGDVLVAKITPCFENGKGTLVNGMKNGIGFGTTEFHVLRAMDIEKEYLYLITTSGQFRKMGEAEMKGAAGQKRVPDEFVKDFVIALPAQKEQLDILKRVQEMRNKIDGIIKKVETQIEKLQEYRQALISNAVTGKIKV